MRVLHIMASAEQGGGARYLLEVLPCLDRLGITSEVVTGPEGPLGPALEAAGFGVSYVDLMQSRFSWSALRQLQRVVRERAPTLVHVHGTRAAFYGSFAACMGVDAQVVYTAHGLSFRTGQAWHRFVPRWVSETWVCQMSAAVMSVSRDDLQMLRALPRLGTWRGAYVPNGVRKHVCRGDKRDARSLMDLPEDAFVVGTVSRLVEQKAVHVLLRAARGLDAVNVVVVGDGPLREELELMAASQGSSVMFLGRRNDVAELLEGFDVFVLSSRWEGESLALLEAMAAGVPCIATDTPGSRAILEGGKAGVLVPVEDQQALTGAIEGLRGNPGERERIVRAGYEAVASRTFEGHADRVVQVYRDVVTDQQGAR